MGNQGKALTQTPRSKELKEQFDNACYIAGEVSLGLDTLAQMIERVYSPASGGGLSTGRLIEGTRSLIASIAAHAKRDDGILADLNENAQILSV